MQNAPSHASLAGLDQTEVRALSERLSSALNDAGIQPPAASGDELADAEALIAQAEDAGIPIPSMRGKGSPSGVPQGGAALLPEASDGLTATQRVLAAKGVKTLAELASGSTANEGTAPRTAQRVEVASPTATPSTTATHRVLEARGFSTVNDARADFRARHGAAEIPPGMTATEACLAARRAAQAAA